MSKHRYVDESMRQIALRSATHLDAAFALHVTEACMRVYAEQTWGTWNGLADLDLGTDEIIQLCGRDIGLFAVSRHADHWFLEKLYLLPACQNRGIGGCLVERLKHDARRAGMAVRLTVLEVNPARRFYERHGFVFTGAVSPRQHLEWRAT
jgi:GNAT superfamily N-acetyltransferase